MTLYGFDKDIAITVSSIKGFPTSVEGKSSITMSKHQTRGPWQSRAISAKNVSRVYKE